ncbi:MAG: TrmH family RNA methyltransferase [Candidatus Doudnabacteria bacterium]|nr:TrmH family RNA methyltransferase [Candidatus Doudnabacteria bacterium]
MKNQNSKLIIPRQFFVIAHNIRSLYNVGSIFRTADALGVSKIYLTGYTGSPENPSHKDKIAKVALGAEDWVPWEHSESAQAVIRILKKQKVLIVGLENNLEAGQKAVALNSFKPKFPLALILGEEVNGINSTLIKSCDKLVEIPMSGKKESLNVSVAFGIAAYYISSKV